MGDVRHFCRILFVGTALLFFYFHYSKAQAQLTYTDSTYISIINVALNNIQINTEESLVVLNESLDYCRAKNDTVNEIRCLIGITDIERYRGDYNLAFDKLWDALILANKLNNEEKLARIHRNLGILYSIFNKDSVALNHLLISLNKYKNLMDDQTEMRSQVISSYFSISTLYRQNEEYHKALLYLDSCQLLKPNTFLPYVAADKGYVYLKTGKIDLAETHLKKANAYFLDKNENYMIVTFLFTGDLMLAQGKRDSAIYYYSESLNAIAEKDAFVEYKHKLFSRLASIHKERGDFRKAYDFLQASNTASEELFNATNNRNNQLFEIKNKYREALQEQVLLIDEQSTVIKEKDKILIRLMIFIGLLAIMGTAGFVVLRLRTSLKKLSLKQMLEEEKNTAILEAKSKELTTYTLQMIDMEKAIAELLETIKTEAPKRYNNMYNKFAKGNLNLWDEFNMRFVEVNGSFYEALRKKHPDLTPTEQKHCALIKLNFDSNEMATILNISLQSVHTSRYRIRKKLKLAHKDNLANYIAEL